MALYTERNNMRKQVEQTSTITVDVYGMLYDICEKYYYYIASKFPLACPDGDGYYGLDYSKFQTHMKYDIPLLYRNFKGEIGVPYYGEDYNQYALFDLIEYISQNCRDISVLDYHSFFKHNHIKFLNTNKVFNEFQKDINEIFHKTGLLYKLTDKMIVERIVENNAQIQEVEISIESIKEQGLKDLLFEAVLLYKNPNPKFRGDAVEKIWDAFERLKTFYMNLDKKKSAEKIIDDMSDGESFKDLFNEEFKSLTNIGNKFRIRHHETDKQDILDIRYYDYFFNRCLALISTAIQYLE